MAQCTAKRKHMGYDYDHVDEVLDNIFGIIRVGLVSDFEDIPYNTSINFVDLRQNENVLKTSKIFFSKTQKSDNPNDYLILTYITA